MPYCDVSKYQTKSRAPHGTKVTDSQDEEGVKIFYQRYGHGHAKVLFIIGLAGTHHSWQPQVSGLCGTDIPCEAEQAEPAVPGNRGSDDSSAGLGSTTDGFHTYREQIGNGIEVCAFDNRGVGNSSIPVLKSQYSTHIMAEDALALLDHLGWEKAHICGHSMGGMIACKLVAMAPHRVASLTLIGVTGGGYQCLPKFNRQTFSIAYRIYRAKTPEERSAVDLDTHYTHDYLENVVGETNRRAVLFKEYVKNMGCAGMQPRYGLEGQASACWHHSLNTDELEAIRSAGIIVAVVHGRGDVIAQVEHARKLARKLHPVSRMIELSGGHLVMNQNTDEVNEVLLGVIRAVRMNVQCTELNANAGVSGMYLRKGGDHWQTGGELSSKRIEQSQECAGSQSQTAAWVVSRYLVKMVPEWLDLAYVFPSLDWASNLCGMYYLLRRFVVLHR